jgi:hypothetical protein
MKKLILIICILVIPNVMFAQLKSQTNPNIKQSLTDPSTMGIFGIFNPDRFSMSHHFSTSFMGGGGGSLMLNTYVNSIQYQISDPLLLKMNLGIANMPHNSYLNNGLNNYRDTQFFGGAELQYRPSANTSLSIGVNIAPNYYYYGYPSRYYRPGF